MVPLSRADDEPDLPVGLQDDKRTINDEPRLPTGLDQPPTDPALPKGLNDEPALPGGIDQPATQKTQSESRLTFYQSFQNAGFAGFFEILGGVRTQNDPYEKQTSAAEARFQLQWQQNYDGLTASFTGDFLYDYIDDDPDDIDLRTGQGWFDLREAWVGLTPLSWMDAKLGRQVLTWGTGDLLFVNDLFPKDWQSFFIGRDLEYLKVPSDAVKISAFTEPVDIDLVYMPYLTPSRYIDGSRISYYNKNLGRIAGRDAIVMDDLTNDPQFAVRLSRKIKSFELAGYGYFGNYNTPEGYNSDTEKAFYPRLNAYGASIRGPMPRGIINFEGAYYDSRQDPHGDDSMIPNSQVRLLTGYETDLPEITDELTLGLQYYVEIMMNYDAYLATLPDTLRPADEVRHLITIRLTKQFFNQTLTLGLFTFYSPSDNDAYLRPKATYKITDNLTANLGANIFTGNRIDTFFGQFQKNTNVYASLRYSF